MSAKLKQGLLVGATLVVGVLTGNAVDVLTAVTSLFQLFGVV
jgi:hypothetical protein